MVKWGEVSWWVWRSQRRLSHNLVCCRFDRIRFGSNIFTLTAPCGSRIVLLAGAALLLLFCCCWLKAKWKFFHCDVVREKYKEGRMGSEGKQVNSLCDQVFCVTFCIKIVSTVLLCMFCFTISIPHVPQSYSDNKQEWERERQKEVTERGSLQWRLKALSLQ